jgi:hypothetical protein
MKPIIDAVFDGVASMKCLPSCSWSVFNLAASMSRVAGSEFAKLEAQRGGAEGLATSDTEDNNGVLSSLADGLLLLFAAAVWGSCDLVPMVGCAECF